METMGIDVRGQRDDFERCKYGSWGNVAEDNEIDAEKVADSNDSSG